MLTLHVDAFFVSPYAMSAFVALEEKGVPYTVKSIGLHTGQHHEAGYDARTGRVPSLKDGDFWLAESSAICEYLEDVFPAPHRRIYPADVRQRAIAREIQAWVRSDLMPIREERPTSGVFYPSLRTRKPLSPAGAAAAQRLVAGLSSLVEPGKTTLFPEWCIADADLGLMLQRLNLSGDPLPPALAAYATASWERPSVRKWVEHARPPYIPY